MPKVEVLQDHTWNGVSRSAGSTYEITPEEEREHPQIVETVVALGYVRVLDETDQRRKALDDEAAARPPGNRAAPLGEAVRPMMTDDGPPKRGRK